jgi:hypothetical protein
VNLYLPVELPHGMRHSNRFCLPGKKEAEEPAIRSVLEAIAKNYLFEELVTLERLSLRGHLLICQSRCGGVRLHFRLGDFRGAQPFKADEDGHMRLVCLPLE